MSFHDQIIQAVKIVMPADAEIQTFPHNEAFNVNVSWKLNDDPERPNKMSKNISICVPHELIVDFTNASEIDQGTVLNRVVAFLSAKLATFDPSHNAEKYKTPPVEQWVISSAIVIG